MFAGMTVEGLFTNSSIFDGQVILLVKPAPGRIVVYLFSGRDDFIGWISEKRKKNLSFIINNNRFLILPWVNVPHLASHVLGKVCRRLNGDWKSKYNHFVYLVETFVQCDRFKGTCYRAANWEYLGKTKGRGKQDVHHQHSLPIKDILVYPLEKSFKKKLCS